LNKVVLHTAIDLLSRREHSIKELHNKLRLKDYVEEDINNVISYLLERDYLSEQRFTESVFRSRVNKGYGQQYIENELRQKGIMSSMISDVANELSVDWYQQALNTYSKKFNNTDIRDQKDKAKRIRFLQYRGFSLDEIYAVLNE